MISCENCIKADVCGKKKPVSEIQKDIELNRLYQQLKAFNIKVNMECSNFLKPVKILKGESL